MEEIPQVGKRFDPGPTSVSSRTGRDTPSIRSRSADGWESKHFKRLRPPASPLLLRKTKPELVAPRLLGKVLVHRTGGLAPSPVALSKSKPIWARTTTSLTARRIPTEAPLRAMRSSLVRQGMRTFMQSTVRYFCANISCETAGFASFLLRGPNLSAPLQRSPLKWPSIAALRPMPPPSPCSPPVPAGCARHSDSPGLAHKVT